MPQPPVEVRIVLNSGGHRSYITTQAGNTLSLAKGGKQSMPSIISGSDQKNLKIYEDVLVGMRMKYGKDKRLTLFAVPQICEPLSGQPIDLCVEKFGYLSHLDLADFFNWFLDGS